MNYLAWCRGLCKASQYCWHKQWGSEHIVTLQTSWSPQRPPAPAPPFHHRSVPQSYTDGTQEPGTLKHCFTIHLFCFILNIVIWWLHCRILLRIPILYVSVCTSVGVSGVGLLSLFISFSYLGPPCSTMVTGPTRWVTPPTLTAAVSNSLIWTSACFRVLPRLQRVCAADRKLLLDT